MAPRKRIVILGATGSIGESAYWVAGKLADRMEVVGLAAASRWLRLAEQAGHLGCPWVAIADPAHLPALRSALPWGVRATATAAELVDMVTAPGVDMVLCAITGTAGFAPVLAAIRAGKNIALASKEILVMAGELVMREAALHKVRMIPVDSEHSAIFQCLEGRDPATVKRLVLTASGGPFRNTPAAELATVTPAAALAHPTWNMGPKITIDSATLFNKALEMIEARWLFAVQPRQIDVVVHPQSIIHSLVEFVDGGLLAQMGLPDMRLPIQYALLHPERVDGGLPVCDLTSLPPLTFHAPRDDAFPALRLARTALLEGGTLPTVLNAANEVAVEAFRHGALAFTGIPHVVAETMGCHRVMPQDCLENILEADAWARATARTLARTTGS